MHPVDRICAKYAVAKAEAHAKQLALQSVEKTSDVGLVARWKAQEMQAQSKRDKDPSSMDIYDLKTSRGARSFSHIAYC